MEPSVCGPNHNLEEKTDCQRLLAGLHFRLKESKINLCIYIPLSDEKTGTSMKLY